MSDSADDQIHDPSAARLQQARSDGDIAKSFELAAALQMIGALLASYLLLSNVGDWIQNWTTQTWSMAGADLSVDASELTSQMQNLIGLVLMTLAPLMVVLLIIGICSHWLQTGPLFIATKAMPDVERLGPGNWKRKMFSLEGLAFLFVGIPKTAIAFGVLCLSSWIHRNQFFELAGYPADVLVRNLFALVLTIVFHVAMALLLTSLADYWLRYLSQQRRLRMTDQQLRDELRMQNGDPQVRARQREFRRI